MGGPGSGQRSDPTNPLHQSPHGPWQSPPGPVTFTGASGVAWIDSLRPSRAGVRIVLIAKFQDRENLKPLWDAIGLPVEFEMRPWAPYVEAKEEANGDS